MIERVIADPTATLVVGAVCYSGTMILLFVCTYTVLRFIRDLIQGTDHDDLPPAR